jgi:hypothetical protein
MYLIIANASLLKLDCICGMLLGLCSTGVFESARISPEVEPIRCYHIQIILYYALGFIFLTLLLLSA